MNDNDNLNVEIARLLGWTNIEPHSLDDGTMTYSGLPPNGSRTMRLPDYMGDPGAALGLLGHVLRQSVGNQRFSVTDLQQRQNGWYVEMGLLWPHGLRTRIQATGESVVLAEAIALACRDALKSLARVDGDDGTGETP